MPLQNIPRTNISDILGGLKVLGGIVLLAAISWEVINGNHKQFSATYLHIQLAVCALFLADFFIRWGAACSHPKFLRANGFFLLISIPWLNITAWSGTQLSHEGAMLLGLIPMIRAFVAFHIVVEWLVVKKISRLFVSYILNVMIFTYLSALIFYDYEVLVNPKLTGFGDALWWACMNLTTVGAELFAVTTIGKIFTVLLPTLGMMMFPIFTTYIMQKFPQSRK